MKRQVVGVTLLLALSGLCGCANISNLGPGGASPGIFYTNATYPNAFNPNMQYRINFDREDIELLDSVHETATSWSLLGVISWGDSGYGSVMDEARLLEADGVMNVTVDTQYMSVLGVFTAVTTKISGQAFRYRR